MHFLIREQWTDIQQNNDFWKPISTFYKDSKITQLKKLSTRWSYFAVISHSLGDKIDVKYAKVICAENGNNCVEFRFGAGCMMQQILY